ncbi:hypothetical protein MRX96_036420 [Rhipicephalus microplus]
MLCEIDVMATEEITKDVWSIVERFVKFHEVTFKSAAKSNLKVIRVTFIRAVAELHTTLEKCLSSAQFIASTQNFNEVLLKFYSAAFRAFHHIAGEDDGSDQYECTGCELDADSCECSLLLDDFENINKKLHNLRLLDAVVRDAVSTVAYKYIEKHIQSTCRGNFESRFLG